MCHECRNPSGHARSAPEASGRAPAIHQETKRKQGRLCQGGAKPSVDLPCPLNAERKMCNVAQIQHVEFEHYHLGEVARFEPAVLRAPVASPRPMSRIRALSPSRASRPYRRSITSRAWRRPSPPAPIHGSRGLSRPPRTPLARRLRSPCTLRLGGRSCPQDPRPFHGDHRATVGCRQRIDAGPDQGAVAPP